MPPSRILSCAALLLVLGLAAPVAGAQIGGWRPTNGPFGGTIITRLAVHPGGDVFAGTESGLFRSSDHGQLWSQTDTGFASNLIRSLLVDRRGDVYAGTPDGLYRSANRGATWSRAGLAGEAVTALAEDAQGVLYAGTEAGDVYRSADGAVWTLARAGLPAARFPITALAAGPDGVLLAGAKAGPQGGGGIYRSTDGGDSWAPFFEGLTTFSVTDLVYSSFAGFFASTDDGDIYLAGAKSLSWSQRLRVPGLAIRSLYVCPGGEVLAGTKGGFIRLGSQGSILSSSYQLGPVVAQAAVVDAQGYVYGGTFGGGVYRLAPGGTEWRALNAGMGSIVTSLAFNARGVLFAGTLGGGVYRTADRGQTWTAASNGLKSLGVEALAVRPDGAVFAGTSSGHVFRSDDEGETWTDTGFPGFAVRGLFVNAKGDLFAGTVGGLFRLAPGSMRWTYTGLAGFDVKAAAIAPGGEMYASLPARLVRSPDGLTWGSAGLMSEVQALAINAGGDVFAGLVGGGVYRALNTGLPAHEWQRVDTTLAVRDVRAFAFTPTGLVVTATYGGGVYLSLDNGGSWLPASAGLTSRHALAFAIHPLDGDLYVGTHAGVFRTTVPGSVAAETPPGLPEALALAQNHPNPFNASTTITFALPAAADVSLAVYDLLGRRVATLVDGPRAAGRHEVRFDAGGLPGGTYLYRLQAGTSATTRTFVLLK